MNMVTQVNADYVDMLQAVINIDHSSRVQTVDDDENPMLFGIISHFNEIIAMPIILNTSFNLNREPIC